MKKLNKRQINKLQKEFIKRTTNKIAFSLDMAKFANEVEILKLKYGEFGVYLAIKSAYDAWDLEKMDNQVGDELKRLK